MRIDGREYTNKQVLMLAVLLITMTAAVYFMQQTLEAGRDEYLSIVLFANIIDAFFLWFFIRRRNVMPEELWRKVAAACAFLSAVVATQVITGASCATSGEAICYYTEGFLYNDTNSFIAGAIIGAIVFLVYPRIAKLLPRKEQAARIRP